MDHKTDNRKLLADVLAESASGDVREAMLSRALLAMHRRRRARQARDLAGILCAAILLAVVVRQPFSSSMKVVPPRAKAVTQPGYQLIHTEPLSARFVVSTELLPEAKMVASAASVTEIATTRGNFRLIGDNELLALTAARPAILIRTGPDSEELVFVDLPDQKSFPAN
jgi:hypothetical protein